MSLLRLSWFGTWRVLRWDKAAKDSGFRDKEDLGGQEIPTSEELRNKVQIYWDDVAEDDALPDYVIGPITTTHLFRWSAAIENWHRIHYDQNFAVNHDRLPTVVAHGTWKQSVMPQYLKDWVLPDGWVWKVSFQHRAMLVPGDTLTVWGRISSKIEKAGMGLVEVQIGMQTQDAVESCPGTATVVLPIRGGLPVPYPFVPPKE